MTTHSQQHPKTVSLRIISAIIGLLILLTALLFFDLQNQGLAWQFFWSKTGEEEPIGQLRGMVEWLGNFTRPPLDTEPITPIDHITEIPYGINTFLHEEVEEAKIHEQLRMISEAGFVWLRQEFPWEDIEVDGRGQFTDSRNDYDDDGEPDTISSWDKYDKIVALTQEYGLRLMVRLSNPPAWSRENPDKGDFAPPDDFQDYVNYAVAVAERYQGQITHFQIWNEPNIFPEWGNQFVNPAGYVELLCRTYEALKQVDPNIVVISGALAPTISIDGYFGYSDLIYLQNMYDNGVRGCFDVLSVQGYGLFSGPTDERVRPTTINFARNIAIRDIMVANGDKAKPIWISEAAWNAVPGEAEKPDVADRFRFGQVTEEQAGRYMPIGYQRADEDWAWIGTIFYWFFTRRTIEESNQSFYYFRMAEADYSPEKPTFTPLPVYHEMRAYIQHSLANPTLYQGVHQADHWAIMLDENSRVVTSDGAQFDQAMETTHINFTFEGTEVLIRWQGEVESLAFALDGETPETTPLDILSDENGWKTTKIFSSLQTEIHRINLGHSEGFVLDSITILNRESNKLFPLVSSGIALFLFTGISILHAIWRRFQ